jgi:hypothetical protein
MVEAHAFALSFAFLESSLASEYCYRRPTDAMTRPLDLPTPKSASPSQTTRFPGVVDNNNFFPPKADIPLFGTGQPPWNV